MTQETTALAVVDAPQPLEIRPPKQAIPTIDEMRALEMMAANAKALAGIALPSWANTPEKIVVAFLVGREHGIEPMSSLEHIWLIKGRFQLSTQAMMGKVRHIEPSANFEYLKYSQEEVEVRLTRLGRPPVTCSYTAADATRSGQSKEGAWPGYQRDMLAYNAVKRCCRLGASDLIIAFSDGGYRPDTDGQWTVEGEGASVTVDPTTGATLADAPTAPPEAPQEPAAPLSDLEPGTAWAAGRGGYRLVCPEHGEQAARVIGNRDLKCAKCDLGVPKSAALPARPEKEAVAAG